MYYYILVALSILLSEEDMAALVKYNKVKIKNNAS